MSFPHKKEEAWVFKWKENPIYSLKTKGTTQILLFKSFCPGNENRIKRQIQVLYTHISVWPWTHKWISKGGRDDADEWASAVWVMTVLTLSRLAAVMTSTFGGSRWGRAEGQYLSKKITRGCGGWLVYGACVNGTQGGLKYFIEMVSIFSIPVTKVSKIILQKQNNDQINSI